jgi:hypothetical protein
VSIFGDQRERQRLVRECELIARCAKLDRATEEPLERPQVRVSSVGETYVHWTDIPTHDFSYPLKYDGSRKFGNLLRSLLGMVDEGDLGNEALRRTYELDAHRFVDDPAVTREKLQRLAEVVRGGRDIERLFTAEAI